MQNIIEWLYLKKEIWNGGLKAETLKLGINSQTSSLDTVTLFGETVSSSLKWRLGYKVPHIYLTD